MGTEQTAARERWEWSDPAVIDFHTHTFPDAIAAATLQKLSAASGTVAFTAGTGGSLSESMTRGGIDCSVVLPVATNPQKVAHINEISAALTGKDRLIYFGCIHPDVADIEGEVRHIARLGLRGVKVHPVYQGVDFDDDRYVRILSACGEAGLLVVTHAGQDIGFPGVVHCSPKMVRRALRLAGPVTLVLAHMGGWRDWDEVAQELADTPVLLDTAFSLGSLTPTATAHFTEEQRHLLSEEAFLSLLRAFGAKRVLFGSDSPWNDQKAAVDALRALPLTEAEKAAILGENARALLRL